MSPIIDLRKHFGLWARCGNTNFWKQLGKPNYQRTFINPADGIMISAHDHYDQTGLAMDVYVYDASQLEHNDFTPAFKSNYPWVKKVMMDFFMGITLIRLGITKETPYSFFLKFYEDQTQQYKETGEGHSIQTGKDELLEAVKRTIGALGEKVLVLKKTILKDEFDEFLEGYGILEC